MRLQKAEHGSQHRRLARPRAQVGGVKTGHVQQALRSVGLGKRPGQRLQTERGGVGCIFGSQWVTLGMGYVSAFRELDLANKVLVVEDNELNLKLFCDLLRAHGYTVEPVRDGREAVTRARDFRPGLIVMDIQLPHVTGYEILLELKADPELRSIPVMAVTAYAGRDDEERIRAAGAKAYVSKPISLQRFINEVRALA